MDMTDYRIVELVERRNVLITYLRVKVVEQDWHGIADAANDLRETDAALAVWRMKDHGNETDDKF